MQKDDAIKGYADTEVLSRKNREDGPNPHTGTFRLPAGIKVPIGYKFILGFILVVATAAFVPDIVDRLEVTEWLRRPLSFLTAILIGLVIGAVLTRNFTGRFSRLTAAARRISMGDLSDTVDVDFNSRLLKDETTDLAEALALMTTNLRVVVEHLKKTAADLAGAQETFNRVVARGHETAKEVISGTAAIFDGALEQANHIDETLSAVKGMAELSDDVARKVTEGANASQKVNSMVQRGANTATSVIEKMEVIFKGIERTGSAAERLREKIGTIPKILDVITHISRQTDLLALNATIEASKAGEHGRGFAMVAEEVRRFADNTNRSVEDVARIVRGLRDEVERVVSTATEGAGFVKDGREDIRKIRDILGDITRYTAEVAENATLILGVTGRQKDTAEKTVDIIGRVAVIAKNNLSTTEKVDAAVERHGAAIRDTIKASKRLSELSGELKTLVARFKLAGP